jgi:hypothetical protein
MPAVTKTLELHLVNPNAHKERQLRETKETYQRALQVAFIANCTTQSEANDVVVNYDPSGYAKNALKQYVPQLCGDSYDADELHDDHPVKFTNEGSTSTTSPGRYRMVHQNPAPRRLPSLVASTADPRPGGPAAGVVRW